MKNCSVRILSLAVVAACLAGTTNIVPADAAKPRSGSHGSAALSLPDTKSEAPVLILVSLENQSLRVFSGETIVARSNVSTGKKGHKTPTGVFSILQKKRRHHSNIYSRAPMPFMQRLTWSGIALHESRSVPSYPASHGCVRLPKSFAKQLFRYTDLGAHVIITDEELDLRPISATNLFNSDNWPENTPVGRRESASVHFITANTQPVQLARSGPVSDNMSLAVQDAPGSSGIADNYTLRSSLQDEGLNPAGEDADPVSTAPVRILITRRTGRELVRDIQNMLNALGFDAGEADGWMGPTTGKAIVEFQKENELTPTGTLSIELADLLRQKSEMQTQTFGHIYVRQAGKPLFDAAVTLKTPHRPLGTHFLTALPGSEGSGDVKWVGATLADTAGVSPLSEISESGSIGRRNTSINDALARIDLPTEIRERLNALSIAGSSLVINDHGISQETLRGTDFVVLTNTPKVD